MGQYFYVVNLDKKEFLHPHKFGTGLKFWEIACGGRGGVLSGLSLLLGTSTRVDSPVAGRWAGDRIAMVGDYDDSERFGGIYAKCGEDDENPGEYEDISYDVIRVLVAEQVITDIGQDEWRDGMWERDGFDPRKT